MKTNKTAAILFGLGLAGLTLNAHALCVNADGTLSDPSIPTGSLALDVMPSCEPTSPRDAANAGASNPNPRQETVRSDAKDRSEAGKLDKKS